MPEDSQPRFLISVVLLCGLTVSWLITDFAGYAMLAVPVLGLTLLARGQALISVAGLVALLFFLGGRWISEQAQITGELMPRLFDLGLAIQAGCWVIAKRAKHGLIALIGATMIAVSIESLEIYYASPLLVRWLAFLGIGLCFWWTLGVGRVRRGAFFAGGGALLLVALLEPANGFASVLKERFGDAGRRDRIETENPAPLSMETGPSMANGRELPRRADLRLDDRLRLYLQLDQPSMFRWAMSHPVYLRTQVASAFRDIDEMQPVRRSEWRYDVDDGVVDGYVSVGEGGATLSGTLFVGQADALALPMLAGTQAIGLASVYEFAEHWYQLALEVDQTQIKYRTQGTPTRVQDLPSEALQLPAEIDPVYLEMPDSQVSERLKTSAGLAKRAPVSAQLVEVRDWVQSQADYSLEYDNPDDLPALENFLYGERRGHCELFAAATVLKLRAAGLPARMAWGYCGGVSVPKQRLIAYRQSDFHAWAEVPIEGHGWVIFDTTPPGEGAMQVAAANAGTGAIGLGGYKDLGGVAQPVSEVRAEAWRDRAVVVFHWVSERFGWFVIPVVVAAWWFGRRRSNGLDVPRIRMGRPAAPSQELADRFVQYWVRKGEHRSLGVTLGEFLEHLKNRGLCEEEFDGLIHYLYGVRYEAQARDPKQERRYLEQLSLDFRGKSSVSSEE